MDDVRQAAEERASRPKKAPVGASFESERQRSKNALVKQIESMDGRNVRMIAAATASPEEDRVLRVAAYCRVSTDDIDQALSIHLQIQQYMKKIKENPNWKYAGCYVGKGISGTSNRRRDGFNRMVEDALAGRIGLILTKSISRFARNTVDSLTTIRKLKEHGTEVYFEKENIWTFDSKGEILSSDLIQTHYFRIQAETP